MTASLQRQGGSFLEYVDRWFQGLQPLSLAQAVSDPSRAAVFSADMVVGFCSRGSLASARIGRLVGPVRELFQRAHSHGIRKFVLVQDSHHGETPEFQAFPPHCVRGSEESRTIPELQALPFAGRFVVVEKNSLHPAIGTRLDRWLTRHPDLRECIVAGDCTDLCTYHLAMHLRLRANAYNMKDVRVIVPASAVETYDLPLESTSQTGALPHPGDFFHRVFLYHLALNGCLVVREVV